MAAPAAVVIYGTATSPLKDEPAVSPVLLVDSLTKTFAYTKTESQNANGTTTYVKYTDPKATLEFTGKIVSNTGLANQTPATTITSLANYSTAEHGFTPSDGLIIYEDPSREYSREQDFITLSFTATHYPYLAA